jgi:hypothetical protein
VLFIITCDIVTRVAEIPSGKKNRQSCLIETEPGC